METRAQTETTPVGCVNGIIPDEIVKTALFKRTSGEPVNHVKALDFSLPIPRQQMSVFASPDTEAASIMFAWTQWSGWKQRGPR